MRTILVATSLALSIAAGAQTVDPAAPLGRLSDAAKPTAYRIDMTIVPDQPRFSGHDEIDAELKAPTRRLYLHGRDLHVGNATARMGERTVAATWTEVDRTGVARLDFAEELPAGPVTLAFDFDAAFATGPTALYRTKVADKWYSWSQFESIDARGAFPSFDEPGFKTPFAITITTTPGFVAVSNAAEVSVTKAGDLERHAFAPTLPLPTYLVAMVTGPFVRVAGEVPANDIRKTPLPLGATATQVQRDKMAYVMAETPRIVGLLEAYFGQPFPFPKLDQIASPTMPGAMENAGADIYSDPLILLDAGATTRQRQGFGSVVSHELAHQWFGDLVTPAWWDDIWLNESFANWMGYRIGNLWRPELNIGIGGLAGGFEAMTTDSLEAGRPIHQPIGRNSEIDSAFDGITYGKGGHVISMIAAYLGDEKFQDGVRLHMTRHRYGNATSEQFFTSLADAAKDPRVLAAMKSFVDQQGVPVVDFRRAGGKLVATQSRYAYLGGKPSPTRWTIPLCLRAGAMRSCTLLDASSATIAAPAAALSATSSTRKDRVLMPNAGGTGYYRFNLPAADWRALIAQGATLPPAEALAVTDSLWAAFAAGKADASWLVDAMRSMVANPDSYVAVDGGRRLAALRVRGLIDDAADPAYRRLMDRVFAPRLTALGFDPAAGAHAGDTPDRQSLRQQLVSLVARQGRDAAVRARLVAAADAYLAGDTRALDQGFFGPALGVTVEERGLPAAQLLVERALASEDAVFRRSALIAASDSGRVEVANWLLGFDDERLRKIERFTNIGVIGATVGTQGVAGDWLLANYESLAAGNGIFLTSRLPQVLLAQCGVDRASHIAERLGPRVHALDAGVLDFDRVVETVRHCGVLRDARRAEVERAIATAR